MAVVRCVKKLGGIEGPNIRPDGSRTYRERWTVTTSSATDTGSTVVAHAALPQLNSAYAHDQRALVTGINPRQSDESPTVWEVEVDYDSQHGDPDRNSDNPLDDPIKLRWDVIEVETGKFYDLDNKLWADSAGTPFADPPPIPLTHLVLVVERNELSYSAPAALYWGNSVNADTYLGADPATILLRTPTATEEYSDGISYWKITYRLEFNPEKWIPYKALNVGPYYRELPGNGGFISKRKRAMDDDNNLGGTAFLDADGYKIDITAEQPTYNEFRFYEWRNFSQLNLLYA